jgi:protein HOOK3
MKIEECESLIEAQELKIEDNRIATERQGRELAARPSAERIEEINDELRMLKVENASLTKKANTVDHYKRKLESVKITEDDNKRLRENLDTLQSNQAFFDEAIADRDQATNTVLEYRKQFEQYENREVDFEVQIRTLREELRNRDSEVELLKSKADHDEEFISDLQEQIRNGDRALLSPDSPVDEASHMTLEEELASPSYDLELSKFKSLSQTLKSSNAEGSVTALRFELEESEKIRKRLEKSLQDLTEKHAVGQDQLQALISTSTSQKSVNTCETLVDPDLFVIHSLTRTYYRDEAIANTRKLYLEANQDLSSTKRQLVDLQAESASRDRELLRVKADRESSVISLLNMEAKSATVSAISRDELRALEELKEANDIATTSLQNDLKFLRTRHKDLEIDHNQARSHLIDALLTKDNLTKELSSLQDGKTSSESPAEVETIKAALQALKEVSYEIEHPESETSPNKHRSWRFRGRGPFIHVLRMTIRTYLKFRKVSPRLL